MLKVNGQSAHTVEFAFVNEEGANPFLRFADQGDSGSTVYVGKNSTYENSIIGMVVAVTTQPPFLTFVTTAVSIEADLKKRFPGIEIEYPN